MKRKSRDWDASRGGFISGDKRQRQAQGALYRFASGESKMGPRRTYTPSLVPIASRGYSPNTTERKVYDIDAQAYNVNTTVVTTPLCLPTLGTDMTQRIGRKICLKTLAIRGNLGISNTLPTPPTVSDIGVLWARLIVLWDTQPNGANPSATDVLKTASVFSPLNLNNRDRFRVLRDKMYTFDPFAYDPAGTATTAWNKTNQNIKIFVKLPNLETIFNATNGGTVADIASGNLIAFWLGSGTGNNGPLDFTGSYRVRFEDK